METSLSDFYEQEILITQGSILYVTLCIVKTNSIVSCIRNGAGILYVVRFGFSYWSKRIQVIAIDSIISS